MQMYLLLNNTCNLSCDFCIRGKQTDSTMIDLASLQKVLVENDFSNYHLLVTGGEPSLHKDMAEIIDICSSHFKGISVNTNGVESSWIDKLNNTDFHVQISIDGTSEYHDMIRGNGKVKVYEKILETIDRLNYRNITYNISTTVGKSNYENVKLLCNKIDALPNVKYWKVSPQLPFGCADVADRLEITRWNELIKYLLENANVLLRVNKLFDFKLLDKYMEKNPRKMNFPKTNCGNVKYKIYVYPDFTVYPCTCLTDFPIGNLLQTNLKEILNNDLSKGFIDYKVNPESVCFQCKYLFICNGGCIGMSYHFFGELGMGDYRCPLMKM